MIFVGLTKSLALSGHLAASQPLEEPRPLDLKFDRRLQNPKSHSRRQAIRRKMDE